MSLSHPARPITTVVLIVACATPLGDALGQTTCSVPKSNLSLCPYCAASAHHRPIGTGASSASNSDLSSRDWLQSARLNSEICNPWSTDVTEPGASDPI